MMRFSSRKAVVIRSISIAVFVAFVSQELTWAAPAVLPVSASAAMPTVSFKVPASAGLIDDFFKAPGHSNADKLIVLIQDAHTNDSAQFNVARVIDEALHHENIRFVFTEADRGNVSLAYLKKYFSPETLKSISDSFVRKGLLKGSEYLSVTGDRDFTLYGVESPVLYDESLRVYAEVAKGRDRALAYLDRLDRSIRAMQDEAFNANLKHLNNARLSRDREEHSVADYAEQLWNEAARLGVYRETYRDLATFNRIHRLERSIDFKIVAEQAGKALGSLTDEARSRLHSDAMAAHAVKQGENAAGGFYAALEEALRATPAGIETLKGLSALNGYFGYLAQTRRMEAIRAIDEIGHLEDDVFERLTRTDEEKYLYEFGRNAEDLKSALLLKMTPRQFDRFVERQPRFDSKIIGGYVNHRILKSSRHYDRAVFLNGEYENTLQETIRFYRLARKRDMIFVERMLEVMNGNGQYRAALFTGGFHMQGIKQILKSKGISYVSVLPQVAHETDQARYEKILLDQAVSGRKSRVAFTRGLVRVASRATQAEHATQPEGVLTGARLPFFASLIQSNPSAPSAQALLTEGLSQTGARMAKSEDGEMPLVQWTGGALTGDGRTDLGKINLNGPTKALAVTIGYWPELVETIGTNPLVRMAAQIGDYGWSEEVGELIQEIVGPNKEAPYVQEADQYSVRLYFLSYGLHVYLRYEHVGKDKIMLRIYATPYAGRRSEPEHLRPDQSREYALTLHGYDAKLWENDPLIGTPVFRAGLTDELLETLKGLRKNNPGVGKFLDAFKKASKGRRLFSNMDTEDVAVLTADSRKEAAAARVRHAEISAAEEQIKQTSYQVRKDKAEIYGRMDELQFKTTSPPAAALKDAAPSKRRANYFKPGDRVILDARGRMDFARSSVTGVKAVVEGISGSFVSVRLVTDDGFVSSNAGGQDVKSLAIWKWDAAVQPFTPDNRPLYQLDFNNVLGVGEAIDRYLMSLGILYPAEIVEFLNNGLLEKTRLTTDQVAQIRQALERYKPRVFEVSGARMADGDKSNASEPTSLNTVAKLVGSLVAIVLVPLNLAMAVLGSIRLIWRYVGERRYLKTVIQNLPVYLWNRMLGRTAVLLDMTDGPSVTYLGGPFGSTGWEDIFYRLSGQSVHVYGRSLHLRGQTLIEPADETSQGLAPGFGSKVSVRLAENTPAKKAAVMSDNMAWSRPKMPQIIFLNIRARQPGWLSTLMVAMHSAVALSGYGSAKKIPLPIVAVNAQAPRTSGARMSESLSVTTDAEGRFSYPGPLNKRRKDPRFNAGVEFQKQELTLKPHEGDWAKGFEVYAKGDSTARLTYLLKSDRMIVTAEESYQLDTAGRLTYRWERFQLEPFEGSGTAKRPVTTLSRFNRFGQIEVDIFLRSSEGKARKLGTLNFDKKIFRYEPGKTIRPAMDGKRFNFDSKKYSLGAFDAAASGPVTLRLTSRDYKIKDGPQISFIAEVNGKPIFTHDAQKGAARAVSRAKPTLTRKLDLHTGRITVAGEFFVVARGLGGKTVIVKDIKKDGRAIVAFSVWYLNHKVAYRDASVQNGNLVKLLHFVTVRSDGSFKFGAERYTAAGQAGKRLLLIAKDGDWKNGFIAYSGRRRVEITGAGRSGARMAVIKDAVQFMSLSDRLPDHADILLIPGHANLGALEAAAEVAGRVDRVIVSGGTGRLTSLLRRVVREGGYARDMKGALDSMSEAEIIRDILIKRGVPSDKILLEPSARVTTQNFENALDLIRRQGLKVKSMIYMPEPLQVARTRGVFDMVMSKSNIRGCGFADPNTLPDPAALSERGRMGLLNSLIGEWRKIRTYPARGYMAPVLIADADVRLFDRLQAIKLRAFLDYLQRHRSEGGLHTTTGGKAFPIDQVSDSAYINLARILARYDILAGIDRSETLGPLRGEDPSAPLGFFSKDNVAEALDAIHHGADAILAVEPLKPETIARIRALSPSTAVFTELSILKADGSVKSPEEINAEIRAARRSGAHGALMKPFWRGDTPVLSLETWRRIAEDNQDFILFPAGGVFETRAPLLAPLPKNVVGAFGFVAHESDKFEAQAQAYRKAIAPTGDPVPVSERMSGSVQLDVLFGIEDFEPQLAAIAASRGITSEQLLPLSDGTSILGVVRLKLDGSEAKYALVGSRNEGWVGILRAAEVPNIQFTRDVSRILDRSLSADQMLVLERSMMDSMGEPILDVIRRLGPVNFEIDVTRMLSVITDGETRKSTARKLAVLLSDATVKYGWGGVQFIGALDQVGTHGDPNGYGLVSNDVIPNAPTIRLESLTADASEAVDGKAVLPYQMEDGQMIPVLSSFLAAFLAAHLQDSRPEEELHKIRTELKPLILELAQRGPHQTIRPADWALFASFDPAARKRYRQLSVKGRTLRGYLSLLIYLQQAARMAVSSSA